MAIVELPFAGKQLTFQIPDKNLAATLSPMKPDSPESAQALISSALHNPIGTPGLKELVSPGARVAIIIDDISRCTPTAIMLPPLLNELEEAGVKAEQIKIVVALGTHRPMTAEEIELKTGNEISKRYRIVNTPCCDEEQLVYMGTSSNGIPAYINKHVAEADLRIGVGMITPHMDVGYSGGAKIILPGVCGQKTVEAFHARQAALYGNQLGLMNAPMRQDLEQFVGERIGLDFILNAVIDQNEQLSGCFAGDFIQAHRQGAKLAQTIFGIKVDQRFPTVIANAYPADIDLWQSVKGLASGELITADGGTLILVTHCPDGNSTHPEYADYIGQEPEHLLEQMDQRKIDDIVACALAVPIAKIRNRVKIVLVSQYLSTEVAAMMGVTYYPDIESALQETLAADSDQLIGVLTHAGISLPLLPETV